MFSILGGDGKEYGPVAVTKIQEWIAGGRANLQTRARRSGETEWRTLGDFPEFGGAVPPPPVVAPSGAAVLAAGVAPAPDAAAPVASGMELASPWVRLGAVLLDSIIACLVLGPGFGLLAVAGAFAHPDTPNTPMLLAGAGTLCLGALVLLAVQLYLLVTRGQTLGKKLLGIRIVTFDTEENPGFVKVFLVRAFINGLIGAVPILGGIYSLVDALFIFRSDHRCIHDLLAGTKVVKA